jgi:hypothetical protein
LNDKRQVPAIRELVTIGKPARPAIPELRRLLMAVTEEEAAEIGLVIFDALERLGADRKDLVAGLSHLVDVSDDLLLDKRVLVKLLETDEDPQHLTSTLVTMLKTCLRHPHGYRRSASREEVSSERFAREVIAKIAQQKRHAKGAIPTLMEVYERYVPGADNDVAVCVQVLNELAAIGPDARCAAKVLNHALKSEDANLRTAAAEAIAAVGGLERTAEPSSEKKSKKSQ